MACHHEGDGRAQPQRPGPRGCPCARGAEPGPRCCTAGCWAVALDLRGLCRAPASGGRQRRNRFSRGRMGQRSPGVGPRQHFPPQKLRKAISAKGQGMHGWLFVPLLMLIKPRSKIQHRSSALYIGMGAAQSQKGIHLLKVVRRPLSSRGRATPVEARPQFRLSLARASFRGDTAAASTHRVSEGYSNAALPNRTRQPRALTVHQARANACSRIITRSHQSPGHLGPAVVTPFDQRGVKLGRTCKSSGATWRESHRMLGFRDPGRSSPPWSRDLGVQEDGTV